jgi:hypothetical protein
VVCTAEKRKKKLPRCQKTATLNYTIQPLASQIFDAISFNNCLQQKFERLFVSKTFMNFLTTYLPFIMHSKPSYIKIFRRSIARIKMLQALGKLRTLNTVGTNKSVCIRYLY